MILSITLHDYPQIFDVEGRDDSFPDVLRPIDRHMIIWLSCSYYVIPVSLRLVRFKSSVGNALCKIGCEIEDFGTPKNGVTVVYEPSLFSARRWRFLGR